MDQLIRLQEIREFSNFKTQPVGQKKANELGFYDLSENVLEWCWDWYRDYPIKTTNDPQGPDTDSYRVYRGGSWYCSPIFAKAASRGGYYEPVCRYDDLGFRVARAGIDL